LRFHAGIAIIVFKAYAKNPSEKIEIIVVDFLYPPTDFEDEWDKIIIKYL